MRKIVLLCTVLVLLVASLALAEQPKVAKVEQPKDIPTFFGYVPGEIIVQFKMPQKSTIPRRALDGTLSLGVQSLDAIAQKYVVTDMRQEFPGAEPKMVNGRFFDLSRYHVIKFDPDADLDEVMEAYRNDPNVESVEPIGIHRVYATPNDGYFTDQWHLNQANDHDVDAPEAWNIETGSDNVTVAILDSGVRYFHKDLGGSNASYSNPGGADGNMWINWAEKNGTAGVDDDGNGYVDDWVGWDFVDGATQCWSGEDCNTEDNDPRDFNGHGTHCAGNVGAINNNGYATCATSGGWGDGTLQPTGNGINVMACRIGWSGTYIIWEVGYVRMDFAASAFYYAADNGAKIASCSWGSSNSGGIDAAIDYFLANGGLIFHAAGNDGNETADYMGSRTDIINVAATDSNDCKADFSNYGTWVDISAPGTGIMSLYHDHGDPQNDYVATMDGTSMATPIAASVAALIWSRNPGWTAAQVEQQLYSSADNIDNLSCNSAYAGKLGAGRVNAYNAVNTGTPPPVAGFTGSPTSGCAPLTVNFTDQSTGDITSWSWDFGDGGSSTAQNPSHTYNTAGTYTVALTVTGPGGSDTDTKTNYITVNPAPTADFVGSPTSGTEPLTVSFTDQSTGSPTSWSWDFGDGGTSTAQNPSHTYNTAGTYTVAMTATNSCGSDAKTRVDYITVNACLAPVADFVGSPTSGDAPLTVNFTDQSTNSPTSWSWDFGDGGTSTAQNPLYTYSTAGTYTVTMTATNACGNDTQTKVDYITVTQPPQAPVAGFTGSPTSGCAPLTVNFTDQSTGDITSWSWDFGDGGSSTAQNPSHTYNTAGTYTVALTVTGPGGSDTDTKTNYITVNPAPTADFVGSPTSGTEPLTVSFTDQSTGSPTSWSWDFGDGGTSTAQNPSHTYSTAGTYTVAMTATNACGNDTQTKVDYITVNSCLAPVADFVGSPTSGDAPLTVNFTDQSTNSPTSWSWDFGDGGTSTAQNPSYTYSTAGTYTVSLTATNSCGNNTQTKVDYITVTQPPVASIVGEVGMIERNQTGGGADWYTVNLNNTYTTPVVVMRGLSYNGGDPTHLRVRNVSTTSFEWQMEEWDYKDGNHTTETCPYMVAESGVNTLEDGTIMQAGVASAATSWVTVTFPQAFASTPTLITGVASQNDAAACITRTRNLTATSFQIKVQEEEAADNVHSTESVAWIAIEQTSGTNNGADFISARTSNSVKHKWYTINFSSSFSATPIFLCHDDTYDGGNTCGTRYRNLGTASVEVKIEEEKSKDTEVSHTTEVVSYVAWGSAGDIKAQSGLAVAVNQGKDIESIVAGEESLPESFEVYQNYPNPFNPTTEISFSLPEAAHVTVDVFNILGQHVNSLLDGIAQAGTTTVTWDATSFSGNKVSSGLYFYRIAVDGHKAVTKKMLLLK